MYFSMFSITLPESSHSYQRIYLHHNLSTVYHYSLILNRASRLARASHLACTVRLACASRTFRRSPPKCPLSSGKPPTQPTLVFPLVYQRTRPLQLIKEGVNLSLLPTVVRRHQHLPLGRQLRSPER